MSERDLRAIKILLVVAAAFAVLLVVGAVVADSQKQQAQTEQLESDWQEYVSGR